MQFKIIAALEENSGIGMKNNLPWSYKKDLKHFSTITKNSNSDKKNAVIMGRKTWESIPNRNLPDRDNLVLTHQNNLNHTCTQNNIFFFHDFDSIHKFCTSQNYNIVWIIGGNSIYNYYISQSYVDELIITRIQAHYDCDTFFPNIPKNFFKTIDCIFEDTDRKTKISNTLSIEYYLKNIT